MKDGHKVKSDMTMETRMNERTDNPDETPFVASSQEPKSGQSFGEGTSLQDRLDAQSGAGFSHIDENGDARMVNVANKGRVRRTATASGKILLAPATIRAINENSIAKGSVLATARIAGIMAAKHCSDLIPLCHNIEIEHVEVNFEVRESEIEIVSRAVCTDKTGIEMEALTAVGVAALTIYDMCKAIDKAMRITDIVLVEKTKEVLQ